MKNAGVSTELLKLLNQALARELQVCVQYMLQHAIGAGQSAPAAGKTPAAQRERFVATHASFWLPGASLKKVAITEMTHAEAIAERITTLGKEPTTQPDPITIGEGAQGMLEIDRQAEQGAIELYGRIIALAGTEQDDVTLKLFQRVLADEQKHHRLFSELLGKD
jgi:bacterioferritin